MLPALMRLSFSSGFHKSFITMSTTCFATKSVRTARIFHDEEKKEIRLNLLYTNPKYGFDSHLNFFRLSSEKCSSFLRRINANIFSRLKKKAKKAGVYDLNISVDILSNQDPNINIDELSCEEVFVKNSDIFSLVIDGTYYKFDVNPPVISSVSLPKENIMADYLLYPNKIVSVNCNIEDSIFTWYKSKDTYESNEKANTALSVAWECAGQDFSILTTEEDINKLYKLVITPRAGTREGLNFETVAKVLVSGNPNPCPFEKRHLYTQTLLDNSSLRVVSYNVLADLYADSDFSRSKLFPSCPPYALAIDYRKQLIIKEVLGYNADLICMQEVDEKLFKHDYNIVFNRNGLNGVFNKKGAASEGLATFFNSNKLLLKDHLSFHLLNELQENPLFENFLSSIKSNEAFFEFIKNRANILQVCVFEDKNVPSRMLISANTHLFWDPESDHIRLLQAGISITLVRHLMELYQKQFQKDVSLIFCGDFNTVPENSIYKLFLSQVVGEDDADWCSKPGQEISGVSFHHDLELGSACGTPPYTNYASGFHGCLDYIFYQTDKFNISQVVPMPSHEEVTKYGALPSIIFPSDHIALVADLKWKQEDPSSQTS